MTIYKSSQCPLGVSLHPLYEVFRSMIDRCYRRKAADYKFYGKRGIKVNRRWLWKKEGRGFLNFLMDMGPRPDGYTLDRIDNDGPYSPQNCRWATWTEQNYNKRRPAVLMSNAAYSMISNLASGLVDSTQR
jgi:hypothetical protein